MSKAVGGLLVVLFVVMFMALQPDDVAGVKIAEVERPHSCESSKDKYIDCFLCGRLANDKRVYEGCCGNNELVNEYCRLMLA